MADVTLSAEVALTQADYLMNKVMERMFTVQHAVFGNTSRFITKRTAVHRSTTVKFLVGNMSGALAESDLESDAGDATSEKVEELEITRDYLRKISTSLKHSVAAGELVDGSDPAIMNIATRHAVKAVRVLDQKEDFLLNSDADAVKAIVRAVYSGTGGVYSQADSCVVTLKNGSVCNFTPYEAICWRSAGTDRDQSSTKYEAVVMDVFEDGNVDGTDLTYPALRLGLSSRDANVTSFDTLAADDELVHYGDLQTKGFDAGFQALATPASTYFGVTRTDAGKNYLNAFNKDFSSGGVDQELDLTALFDWLAGTLDLHIGPTRAELEQERKTFTGALVCQVPPALMPSIERQCGDSSRRWTVEPVRNIQDAKLKKVIAVYGYDGQVVKTMSLPPIAFVREHLMRPDTVRLFAPEIMEWLQLGTTSRSPTWLANDANGRWHTRRNVTTGNLSPYKDAYCWRILAPFCRVPKLVAQATGMAAG